MHKIKDNIIIYILTQDPSFPNPNNPSFNSIDTA